MAICYIAFALHLQYRALFEFWMKMAVVQGKVKHLVFLVFRVTLKANKVSEYSDFFYQLIIC